MNVKTDLNTLLNREVKVIPVRHNGKSGYLPEYFNYADRNSVSELFSESEEGALTNLLHHLQKNKGESDGTNTTG